ncbi:MAG: hypothetical protein MPJ24_02740 [Pirellulaceae bacterium]|nr:hypothetical protein [Pirellulaceae bacterium]
MNVYVLMGVALTFLCWGSYGTLLHHSQDGFQDKWKAIICVGVAYFFVAILVPMLILHFDGKLTTGWTTGGIAWGLLAGGIGALGAIGIVYAMSQGGKPILVMPMVFGMAPIVNTFISISVNKQWGDIRWTFYLGICLVIVGAITAILEAPKKTPKVGPQGPKEASSKNGSPQTSLLSEGGDHHGLPDQKSETAGSTQG